MKNLSPIVKKLISFCLITLLFVNSNLIILPSSAIAEEHSQVIDNHLSGYISSNHYINEPKSVNPVLLNGVSTDLPQLSVTNQLIQANSDITEVFEIIVGITLFIVGFITGNTISSSKTPNEHNGNNNKPECSWFTKCTFQ
jgi:hypothetical protein